MSVFEILDIVLVVLFVIAYLYFRSKGNVLEAVSELIAIAETTGLTGKEKMSTVVEGLYSLVPAVFRKFLTREVLQRIAQGIFEWMRKYAEARNAAKEGASDQDVKDEVKKIDAELISSLIAELLNMTNAALKEKAKEYGIEVDEKAQKREIIQAILIAVMKKA